ncbi:class I SAM-dependent methyltransferase [Aquibium carbonis]|uniref:Class I SAM-dependent methyltransferase n=1 Tax=Aquibium carbonis TaxID=2495581 RepID=A0A3S0AQ09_9HYPH|nr:class I SAM-dependent methyltransferase [Aquibium carbonis]RST84427.1 class I SAM-dependent methyltransferase [Aquibium carbonis]
MNVDFAHTGDVPVKPCRVCGAGGATLHLTLSPGPNGRTAPLRLFRCPSCASFYFDGEEPAGAYEDMPLSETFWLDYVQVGAGISAMLAPLLALRPLPDTSLIDVGAGFGFIVDFWRRRGHAAVGIEPSHYGQLGREKLGIDNRPGDLDAFIAANPGQRFGIVYSSEVIEHTPDPQRFIDSLVALMADDGTLILTTPSTAAVSPETESSSLIAVLSPGFHYTIISPQALSDMLSRHGLQVRTHTEGVQTFVWARRRQMPDVVVNEPQWPLYLDYLENLAAAQDPHVSTGALCRLFKDSLNTGDAARAGRAYERLLTATRRIYAFEIEEPNLTELLQNSLPLALLDRFPAWLGNALLFGALQVGFTRGDYRTKLRMLDAAVRVLERRAEVERQFGQEAAHFLPFARRQYQIALCENLQTSLPGVEKPLPDDLRRNLDSLQTLISGLED